MNKARCQTVHAKRRAIERYELWLSDRDLEDLALSIRRGKGRLVERQSLRVALYDIEVKDKTCRVVYDRHRKTIVSFLPKGARSESEVVDLPEPELEDTEVVEDVEEKHEVEKHPPIQEVMLFAPPVAQHVVWSPFVVREPRHARRSHRGKRTDVLPLREAPLSAPEDAEADDGVDEDDGEDDEEVGDEGEISTETFVLEAIIGISIALLLILTLKL